MAVFDRLHGQGNTIIMVTHEAHIAEYAERVIYLLDGRIEREERRSKTAVV
jgi:putative ABC transport system ATP-binding protein